MSRLSWQSPKDFFEDLWGTWEDLSRPEKHKPAVRSVTLNLANFSEVAK